MNLIKDHSKEPSAHIAISTAFRLPIALLGTVDAWCDQNDVTRSQFFRKSIMDRIKALGIECIVPQPKEQERQWSPELYERLQRKR